ncbi:membrane protein insertion efficiency factor YidD [Paenibacillus eucommiae]|uniref:Putative membrane protein insertion efficiency factor n=1 Tax=Paenibacillus eucommiae TaxID=1355755 RepID=A0ABS4INJ6_9BACL|nr:membrane protein insertion efficiency factor YidD [Paenibacillus eucommiae]MBP1989083.1 putative membrane protein insertion efficiency factor [Paenibacillus eucommiae]
MRRALKVPIQFYRKFISPLTPPSCRFYPTCSQYALEALDEHGALKGSWLAAKRIVKCHPFHPGGIDHVPPSTKKRDAAEDGNGHKPVNGVE